MRVLVACEESQAVCIAFRELGHEAYSCDILPCSGGHPEWHIQDDVLKHLADGWDLMIAHPPCTHLAVCGAKWFKLKQQEQTEAIRFFMALVNAPISRIAIENPVCIMSTKYRRPDQYIQPWQFGHKRTKKTGLWLKNLPPLQPTNIVEPDYIVYKSKKNKSGISKYDRLWGPLPSSDDRRKLRSVTFPGIAQAMAEQWGGGFTSPSGDPVGEHNTRIGGECDSPKPDGFANSQDVNRNGVIRGD